MKAWLIGAGKMAQDYYRVIRDLDCKIQVFGRGAESANEFSKSCGVFVNTEGIKSEAHTFCSDDVAIVTVNVEQLVSVTLELIDIGFKKILLEKPGALKISEINNLAKIAKSNNVKICIAYNRRHYAAVIEAKKIIIDDGGATSCNFEITEWAHIIENLKLPYSVKKKWMIANTSHVMDLAFYLIGAPKKLNTVTAGTLSWHPASARFAGSGITEMGCIFSYHGDWEGVGRWGLEISTRKHRLIMRPLEKLVLINEKTTKHVDLQLDYSRDDMYKPGLYNQVNCFIKNDLAEFATVGDQAKLFRNIYKIAGYSAD